MHHYQIAIFDEAASISMVLDFELVQQAYQKFPMNTVFGYQLSNQWLSTHICVKAIIIICSNSLDVVSGLDAGKFNKVMSASKIWGHPMQYYDSTNITSVWHLKHGQQFYYMITKHDEQVKYPVNLRKAWAKQVEEREVDLLQHTHLMDEAELMTQMFLQSCQIQFQKWKYLLIQCNQHYANW